MRPILAPVALLALALTAGACGDRGGAQTRPPAPPAVPVAVATAEERQVPMAITAVGTVQSYTTVSVKPQVAGQITQVHFAEGQEVKQGQPLFTIDPRPMEAALRQAEANLARDRAAVRSADAALAQRRAEVQQALANLQRDQAQMENARVQEQRYRTLMEDGLVARDQYDQIRTNFLALQATVQADQAAVANARASAEAAVAMVDNGRAVLQADAATIDTTRIQVGYSTIAAPMDGRTGNLLVQAGNVVKANDDNPLVVIAQVRPIYVSFAVPQPYLAAIRRYRAEGPLRVAARPDATAAPVAGVVTFMNNTVDASTGTIQLKATFPNGDHALWPGQFVDVTLTLASERALVIPSQAVQAGQHGPFVFVVKPDLTVESRPVKIGRRLAREVTIVEGLAAGDRVVTDGQLRLVPGARIEIGAPKAS